MIPSRQLEVFELVDRYVTSDTRRSLPPSLSLLDLPHHCSLTLEQNERFVGGPLSECSPSQEAGGGPGGSETFRRAPRAFKTGALLTFPKGFPFSAAYKPLD